MSLTNCTLLSQELREHILHMRREMTRQDRSPLPVRQRLAQRLTELLNQMPTVTADVGFRRVEKDAEPGDACTHVCNREPNDWEMSSFVIERLVAIGVPRQHQLPAGGQSGPECGEPAVDTIPVPGEPESELEQLRDALAIANDRTATLERERDQARLAALSSGQNPIAVISHPRSDADPDEGPFMEAHYWLRLRKLPGGTKLYTAPPLSLNLIHLLEAGNPLSNTAYSLALKPGHSLATYDCELLAQLRENWDAAVSACTQPDSALEN